MKKYLGVINLDIKSTAYVFELSKELEHWKSGKKWGRYQKDVPENMTEDINRLIIEIEEGLEKEKADIKREVLAVYPDATGFDLGDGVAYVWRE